jgi:RNA polymerase sigma factor (sigma-70 family)
MSLDVALGGPGRPAPGRTGPHGEATDEQLLQAMADGDRAALEQLYARHARPLLAYLTRLLDRPSAEEALQDTLVTAWRRAGSFAGSASASAWLHGIARRQAANRRRRREGEPAAVDELTEVAATGQGPEDAVLAAAAEAELAALIGRLPARQQEALTLVLRNSLTYAEAAEVLDVPVGTVKSRLHAAKHSLAALLREQEASR